MGIRTTFTAMALTALLASGWSAAASLYYAPVAPTDPGTGAFQLPWQVYRQDAMGYGMMPELDLPGHPAIDALHRMDVPGRWLLSLAAPGDLGGALPMHEHPGNVLLYDSMTGLSRFFCGVQIIGGMGTSGGLLPPDANIDSLYLDPMTGGDAGDLIVGFDAPVQMPGGAGVLGLPPDLLRFRRTGPACDEWMFLGKAFDSQAAGDGIPLSTNIVAAAPHGGSLLFVVDRPTVLTPSDLMDDTAWPWTVVEWDGVAFHLFDIFLPLAGAATEAFTPPPDAPMAVSKAALSCAGNPGAVPPGAAGLLELAPSAVPGELDLSWPPSCSGGADDYAIYEGAMASWTSHVPTTCSTGGSTAATIPAGPGNHYYLVVPLGGGGEGSYGRASDGTQRPPSMAACASTQILTSCP